MISIRRPSDAVSAGMQVRDWRGRPGPGRVGSLPAMLLALVVGLVPATAAAEVVRFEITERTAFAEGESFGDVGPYERIVGRVHYAVDPDNAANATIVDLDHAEPNEQGLVEFTTDLFMLAPKDPARGNGALFYEVNNRGNKRAMRDLNDGRGGNDPDGLDHAGHGFLFEQGFTIVWSGWVGELLPGNNRLRMLAPVARGENGEPITGPVRYEILVREETDRVAVAPANHGAYPPADDAMADATLTWRRLPDEPRVPIPRDQYRIEIDPGEQQGDDRWPLPVLHIDMPGGFKAGMLYELIYEARDPTVHGLCFAGVRDLITALKHGEGEDNPLRIDGESPYDRAIGFGVSQSGRFLRELLYWGLNVDEQGRQVFEGLIPHVSGAGLGSFNHRFARPTLYAGQYERHDTPSDRFPFTYATLTDPLTGRTDGILQRARASDSVPYVMHTQSSVEYWSRANSLSHTDPLGQRDVHVPDSVRIYAFGGTQHVPGGYPPSPGGLAQQPRNPGDYRPLMRGLIVALDRWITEGREPPPSVYPTIADDTLVPLDRAAEAFPAIPSVRFPQVIHQPALLDYGSRWEDRHIIDRQPPRIAGRYNVRVAAYDDDGNERGTLDPPEVAVPLATFAGWNLRTAATGAPDQLVGLSGSYIAFPRTEAERERLGDPRRSIRDRYGSLSAYLERLRAYCADLVEAGYLLEDDKHRILDRQQDRAAPLFEDDDA